MMCVVNYLLDMLGYGFFVFTSSFNVLFFGCIIFNFIYIEEA